MIFILSSFLLLVLLFCPAYVCACVCIYICAKKCNAFTSQHIYVPFFRKQSIDDICTTIILIWQLVLVTKIQMDHLLQLICLNRDHLSSSFVIYTPICIAIWNFHQQQKKKTPNRIKSFWIIFNIRWPKQKQLHLLV